MTDRGGGSLRRRAKQNEGGDQDFEVKRRVQSSSKAVSDRWYVQKRVYAVKTCQMYVGKVCMYVKASIL